MKIILIHKDGEPEVREVPEHRPDWFFPDLHPIDAEGNPEPSILGAALPKVRRFTQVRCLLQCPHPERLIRLYVETE